MPLDAEQLEKASFILKTIAHPLRLGVVQLLRENKRLSVSELCKQLGCEQSLVSHHLNIMKLKKVLACEREGKKIYYFLALEDVVHVLDCMENCADRL